MKDLLTIIIPLFNAEDFIVDALKILESRRNEFSVIVIDDCSTDRSRKVATEYINNFPDEIKLRTKIISHKNNLGLSASRNSGLNFASSKYIFFLDADDVLIIDKLLDILYEIDNNVDIIHFGYKKFFANLEANIIDIKNDYSLNKPSYYNGAEFLLKYLKNRNFESPVWQRCYRTDYLKNNQLFFRVGIYHEDEDWSVDTIINAAVIADFNEVIVYLYRKNISSISNDLSKSKSRAKDIFEISIRKIEKYKYYPNYELKTLLLDYYSRLICYSVQLDGGYDFHKIMVSMNFSYSYRSKVKSLYLLIYSILRSISLIKLKKI